MLKIQKEYHNENTENRKKTLKQKIDFIDREIDKLVYELYGLSEE